MLFTRISNTHPCTPPHKHPPTLPGGLPPDEVVEYDDDLILQDMQRCIETYHDDSKYSMLRMGLAPCAPFNVTNNLMVKAAALARSYNKVGERV